MLTVVSDDCHRMKGPHNNPVSHKGGKQYQKGDGETGQHLQRCIISTMALREWMPLIHRSDRRGG